MAYIGVQPTDTYLSIASQQITGTGSATYTLNYSVSDEESVAVFVNNVRQNVSSYTVSGDQLTLGGTISASDECWVLFLGRTVGTKTPAVGSVTNDMLAGSIATSKLADGSTFATTNGITIADQWRLIADFLSNGDLINLERVDDSSYGSIGTGMSESSGEFTFPNTGKYLLQLQSTFRSIGGDNVKLFAYVSLDGGSNYDLVIETFGGSESFENTGYGSYLIDVTNTSNTKVKFTSDSVGAGSYIEGSTSSNKTSFLFIKLGDT